MKTILVVEDEITTWMALEFQLRRSNLGATLHRAAGHEEVADSWLKRSRELDLAIIDLQLPVENAINPDRGFDVIARIQEKYPATPIIVLTGRNDKVAYERTHSYPSVCYFIIKPWSQARLIEAAAACLGDTAASGRAGNPVLIGKLT
jgi:CheY-like chemotaxis protein